MPAGTVEVFLIGATGIKDTEIFGKADPYAVLVCGKQKLRSNTASNQGSRPMWNQRFSFFVDEGTLDLKIRILNHNIVTEDDEIGSSIVPLTKAFSDGKLPTTSYNVVRPSGRVQGEVKLSVTFTPKNKASATVPSIAGPYGSKNHSSPYKPESGRHDPLTGPYGYYPTNVTSGSSSFGHLDSSASSHPTTSTTANPYPPRVLPPESLTEAMAYQRENSVSSFEHSDSHSSSEYGSGHGRYQPPTSSYPSASPTSYPPSSATEYSKYNINDHIPSPSAPSYFSGSSNPDNANPYKPEGAFMPYPARPPSLNSSVHGAPSFHHSSSYKVEDLSAGVASLGLGENSGRVNQHESFNSRPPYNAGVDSYPTAYPAPMYPSSGIGHAPPSRPGMYTPPCPYHISPPQPAAYYPPSSGAGPESHQPIYAYHPATGPIYPPPQYYSGPPADYTHAGYPR